MMTLSLLFYTGITLIAVPLIMMIVLSAYVTYSFIQDDDMTAGIFKIAVIIMLIGAAFVGLRYALEWLQIGM